MHSYGDALSYRRITYLSYPSIENDMFIGFLDIYHLIERQSEFDHHLTVWNGEECEVPSPEEVRVQLHLVSVV